MCFEFVVYVHTKTQKNTTIILGFHLTVDKWIKKGVLEHESRTFRVAFTSSQENAEWLQWIQFCIERIAYRHRDKFSRSRVSSDLTNESESVRVTSKITPRGASVKEIVKLKKDLLSKSSLMDSVLFVVIRQGLGLQLHSCSTCGGVRAARFQIMLSLFFHVSITRIQIRTNTRK